MTDAVADTIAVPAPVPAARRRHPFLLAVREARPAVQVIFLLRFLCGSALTAVAGTHRLHWPGSVYLVAWWMIITAIYLRNGISDVVEDRINGSIRPIASGALREDTARWIARGLAVTGIAVATLARPTVGVVGLAILGVGWSYSVGARPLKASTSGFLFVVVTGGLLTYAAGALAAGGVVPLAVLAFPAVMSAWMGLAGSTKDLSDVAGDREAGRRTLPVMLGFERARLVIGGAVAALAAGYVWFAAACVPALLPTAIVLAAGAVVTAATTISARSADARDRRRRPYRAFMITQYVVHITLLVSVLI